VKWNVFLFFYQENNLKSLENWNSFLYGVIDCSQLPDGKLEKKQDVASFLEQRIEEMRISFNKVHWRTKETGRKKTNWKKQNEPTNHTWERERVLSHQLQLII